MIHKTAEATSDLIGNEIADKITRISKTSPKEILRENYISPEILTKNYCWLNIKRLKEKFFL